MTLQSYIELVNEHKNLTLNEMLEAARYVFDESTDASLIKQFLISLSEKGETAEEIAGLATVMKQNALPFDPPEGLYIDNCGTGGDGLQTFNISTTSAFVLAAAGVKVAKHGNRKISSQAGSSDVLEALGIHLIEDQTATQNVLKELGIAFLHAPNFHPKLARIGAIRREIGKPTIFNLVGPLTNPVPLKTQFVGISRANLTMQYAEVLYLLGRKRAVVVTGAYQMDEANLAGENHFVLVDHGDFIPFKLRAEDVGLSTTPLEAIKGGSPAENAIILREVLNGIQSPYLDTVLLNSGIALFSYGAAPSIQDGITMAREVILNGSATQLLNKYIEYSQKVGVQH